MTDDEVRLKLTTVFHSIFKDPALVIRDDMTAGDIPAWDSLAHINLIFAVEKAFGVKFSIKDSRSLKNVGELVALVLKKLK